MINFAEKISTYLQTSRKSWAPAVNYAYNSGHPCARNLVYCRLNWQEKPLPNLNTLLIFREGDTHEKAVIQLLTDAGIEIVETQRPFEIKQIQLRGKIDGQIRIDDGSLIPAEIKSLNPYDFEAINGIEDMKKSTKVWIRGYITQMQMYLFGMEKPLGVFILKNKVNGQLKFVFCPIDYEYAEKEWKKLESVNQHVAAGTYPDRIDDRAVCQYCDFRHICLPDEASDSISILENPEILELLEQREKLRAAAKDYDALDKKLKTYWDDLSEGTHLVGGKFQVKVSTYDRTVYEYPPDIKDKYATKVPATRVTVTTLK